MNKLTAYAIYYFCKIFEVLFCVAYKPFEWFSEKYRFFKMDVDRELSKIEREKDEST